MSDTSSIGLIPQSPGEVAKAITYLGVTALAIVQAANGDNTITTAEFINVIVQVIVLIPVYLISGTLAKTAVAFSSAALQALILLVGDPLGLGDVTLNGWISVALAAFAAIGIAYVPNKKQTS